MFRPLLKKLCLLFVGECTDLSAVITQVDLSAVITQVNLSAVII